MKKILSIVCCITLLSVLLIPSTVNAASATGSYGPRWTKESNGDWSYSDGNGTSLIARIDDDSNTLYIKGTGAVPAYSRDCLGNRPWNGSSVTNLEIFNGVTSIGAEAFSNLKYLHNVTMSVSVFVEDPSAFGAESDGCIFNFTGMNIVSRNVGKIPYTSLDSIASMMVKFQDDYIFKLDNYYMIGMAKNSAGSDIRNLAPADAKSGSYNVNYPYYDITSKVDVVNANGNTISGVNAISRQQGSVALEVFSLVIGDMEYAASYNISAYNSNGVIQKTTTPVQYTMTIPTAFQCPGRQFSLIQIGTGEVNILADEDANDTTITFTTTYGNTVYALCYSDLLTQTDAE